MREANGMAGRIRGRWLALALSVAAVATAACDSAEGPTAAVPGPSAALAAGAATDQAAQDFARLLALTLNQPGTRGVLHQAMRESRFTEHKLVLQHFLATPQGDRLVKAMAAAGGVNETVVRGWANQLPPMDFYVPFSEHRRNWAATADVVVGANLDVDQTQFIGYTPQGQALRFDARDGTPKQTVVFLHPAEPKGIRPSSGPARGNGRTIEDPSEPISSVLMIDSSTCDPETAIVECDTETGGGGGGGGGGGTTGPATYDARLWYFKNWKGDGVGGIELLVRHYAGRTGPKISEVLMDERMHWSWDGYYWDYRTDVYAPMKFASTGATWITVYERDSGAESWFGSDDFWGEGQFGGLDVLHRFRSTSLVEYVGYGHPCYPAREDCIGNATVDIAYIR